MKESIVFNAAAVALLSACAAALFVVWLSIVVGLRRHSSTRAAAFAALVLPAPPLAWRAGLRARAVAMVALIVIYVVLRIASA